MTPYSYAALDHDRELIIIYIDTCIRKYRTATLSLYNNVAVSTFIQIEEFWWTTETFFLFVNINPTSL